MVIVPYPLDKYNAFVRATPASLAVAQSIVQTISAQKVQNAITNTTFALSRMANSAQTAINVTVIARIIHAQTCHYSSTSGTFLRIRKPALQQINATLAAAQPTELASILVCPAQVA